MSQTVVERTAGQIAGSARQASRATSAIADAIEDGVEVVKSTAKQGGDAAADLLNEASDHIQRYPVRTVAATLAIGVTAGALIGWMMRQR